jgi:hypothetical protein
MTFYLISEGHLEPIPCGYQEMMVLLFSFYRWGTEIMAKVEFEARLCDFTVPCAEHPMLWWAAC